MGKLKQDLFELIKSLDRNEKGYFKKYTLLHSTGSKDSANYIKLFDAIDAMEEYNEADLKKTFGEEKFIKQLFVTKNYLYNAILKSLRSYSAQSTDLMSILTNTQNVEILIRKGHYKKALKYIHKTRKFALEGEYWGSVLELIEMEKAVCNALKKETSFEVVAAINTEKKKVVNTLVNDIEFNELSYEIVSIRYKYGRLVPENKMKKIKAIMSSKLMKTESNAASVYAKELYTTIRSIYYDLTDQGHLFYLEMLRAYNTLKKHPFAIRKNPDVFFSQALNAVVSLERQHMYPELNSILNEISQIENRYELKLNPKQKGRLLEITLRAQLISYINTFQLTKGLNFLKTAVEQLEAQKKNTSIETMTSFYFTAASLLFLTRRYKDAITYLNRILIFNPSALNKNETLIAQYLLLITHYELKNHDLLAYVNSLFKHNESIEALDYLRTELPYINSLKQEKKVFVEFKRLLLMSDKKYFLQTFFDFLSWAESKIQNRSYSEIIRKMKE